MGGNKHSRTLLKTQVVLTMVNRYINLNQKIPRENILATIEQD